MTHTPFFYEELWRKAGRASLEIPPPRLDRVGVGDTGRGGGGVGSTFRFSTKCSILFYGSRRGGSGVGVCIIVAKKSKKAWILCSQLRCDSKRASRRRASKFSTGFLLASDSPIWRRYFLLLIFRFNKARTSTGFFFGMVFACRE